MHPWRLTNALPHRQEGSCGDPPESIGSPVRSTLVATWSEPVASVCSSQLSEGDLDLQDCADDLRHAFLRLDANHHVLDLTVRCQEQGGGIGAEAGNLPFGGAIIDQ